MVEADPQTAPYGHRPEDRGSMGTSGLGKGGDVGMGDACHSCRWWR